MDSLDKIKSKMYLTIKDRHTLNVLYFIAKLNTSSPSLSNNFLLGLKDFVLAYPLKALELHNTSENMT